MTKARNKSPAKAASPKEGRSPGVAPSTRATSRKPTPTKKTESESPKRVTKKSPAKTITAKSPSPGKASTKSAMAPTGTKRAASRSVSPAKPAKAAKKTTGARKRGPIDEDDSGFDPDESLQDIIDEIGDARRHTKLDKELIDWITILENGTSKNGILNVGQLLFGALEPKGINCNYKLYWRFRTLFDDVHGPEFIPTWQGTYDSFRGIGGKESGQGNVETDLDDCGEDEEDAYVYESIEYGSPRAAKRTSTRSPSRSPAKQAAPKSTKKLGKVPDLSPGKKTNRSVRATSANVGQRTAKAAFPVRPICSPSRVEKRQQSPRQRSPPKKNLNAQIDEKLVAVETQALHDTEHGLQLDPYNTLNEWKDFITEREFKYAQQTGANAAQPSSRADQESALRTFGDQSEQRIRRQTHIEQVDEMGVVIPQPSAHPAKAKSLQRSLGAADRERFSPLRQDPSRASPSRQISACGAASPSPGKVNLARKTASLSPTGKSPSRPPVRKGTGPVQKARGSPTAAPKPLTHYDEGIHTVPAKDEGRGNVFPLTHKPHVKVTIQKPDGTTYVEERDNTFFETMPASEVWHRNMPPYLPFGETRYQEYYQSCQINEDLSRTEEQRTKERGETLDAEKAAKSPGLTTRLASYLWGDGSSATKQAPPTRQRGRKGPVVLPPSPFELPEISAAGTKEKTAGVQRRKAVDPPSPAKRRAAPGSPTKGRRG